MQNGAGLGSVFIIQPVYHKNMRKNVLNNQHGDFCESGISACPESVGVGKFCRLRLRLRLRGKQPTPTDSDSGSDSDSAALDGTIDSRLLRNAIYVRRSACKCECDHLFTLREIGVQSELEKSVPLLECR